MYIFKEEDNLYEWISCLVKDSIYFGPYPNKIMTQRLISEQFDYIIDLTNGSEEDSYISELLDVTTPTYIHFPIQDHSIPYCTSSYCNFIIQLKSYIKENKKIYIHCRGGHGRSSMTSISLYYLLNNINLKTAIETVTASHNERINLRDHWKSRKMPIHYIQFQFLNKIHKNIYVNMKNYNKYYYWLYWNGLYEEDNTFYKDPYDFFKHSKQSLEKKEHSLFSFYINRFKENKELVCKLHLTFLKKFILTDSEDEKYTEIYQGMLTKVREELIYKNLLLNI
jgi:hypothetical protein